MRLGMVFMAAVSAAQPTASALPEWMVGDWGCYAHPAPAGGPVATEEYWISTSGNLVGVGRVHRVQTTWLEQMRIAPDAAGRLTFYGSPGGAPPVAFPMARSGAREIVFENPNHDFPQRISYRSDGTGLVATVSLLDGSRAETWHFAGAAAMSTRNPPCNPPRAGQPR